jgi:hypothetical protein
MTRNYDPKDFAQDPGKYRLFKTAVTRSVIINENGHVDAGTVVGLTYLGVARNQLYRRSEPIYKLTTGDVCYANGLTDFCL